MPIKKIIETGKEDGRRLTEINGGLELNVRKDDSVRIDVDPYKEYQRIHKEYCIDDYDRVKAFSSFLPGIAGKNGIPMWSFYVNRGQGICSFGVEGKNNPITEFFPANGAYQYNHLNGFRSFIKINKDKIYEVFAPHYHAKDDIKRSMKIKMNQLSIEEINFTIGIRYGVTYFVLPNENFAALVREVVVENIDGKEKHLEIIDGHPAILPAGIKNEDYKAVGNLLRSWMEVYNLENKIAFYKLRGSTSDEAEVKTVEKGHFFLSFSEDQKLIQPIVDMDLIFGTDTGLTFPVHLLDKSVTEIGKQQQITANKVPGAFAMLSKTMQPSDKIRFTSLIGHVAEVDIINQEAHKLSNHTYIELKQKEAEQLVKDLTEKVKTKTSNPLFDAYISQSFLDNLLRGGYPEILDNKKNGFVYHIYSRKHGDPEREYNAFYLAKEFYSQGNGNYRDVNQNRRNDVFIEPRAGLFNIKTFMNLIQIDGYNPLLVKGTTFILDGDNMDKIIEDHIETEKESIRNILKKKFTPGMLICHIRWNNVTLKKGEESFLNEIFSQSKQCIEAAFGEGYWSDHFTYNMDLIENYLSIFPDKERELLFEEMEYKFFDSSVYVLPRSEKYVLTKEGKVRQYGSIIEDHKKMKRLNMTDKNETRWLETDGGEIYKTNLFVKLLSLATNKFLLLDPYGMGIEMEANKPGWNDAMNGLPGLLGSGLSETFELIRIFNYLENICQFYGHEVLRIPVEMNKVITNIIGPLQQNNRKEIDDLNYWQLSADIRENYRSEVRFTLSGKEAKKSTKDLLPIIEEMNKKLHRGICEAKEVGNGLYPTYFTYKAKDFEMQKDHKGKEILSHYDLPKVKVKSFTQKPIIHFLEAPTRAMKVVDDQQDIYHRVKNSDMYDKKLKMYKTSCSLKDESSEIGRIKAFTPGWLERESIFLHMTYKYMLSLLKAGLYEEFYEEAKTNLIYNLNPSVYGRSPLENSSFIASSVNPNPRLHGQGFVARLSGSTAEMLSMWILMMNGKRIFGYEKGQLYLELSPILTGDMFTEQGCISYTFLGHTQITYINKSRKNTIGQHASKIYKIKLDDSISIKGNRIVGQYAEKIRSGEIQTITAYMKERDDEARW